MFSYIDLLLLFSWCQWSDLVTFDRWFCFVCRLFRLDFKIWRHPLKSSIDLLSPMLNFEISWISFLNYSKYPTFQTFIKANRTIALLSMRETYGFYTKNEQKFVARYIIHVLDFSFYIVYYFILNFSSNITTTSNYYYGINAYKMCKYSTKKESLCFHGEFLYPDFFQMRFCINIVL